MISLDDNSAMTSQFLTIYCALPFEVLLLIDLLAINQLV